MSHRMMPAYRVGRRGRREQDIMYEIMTQGPVLAIMEIFRDFFSYKSGVYQRSVAGGTNVVGYHAVRIIGWGEDTRVGKYWHVTNTWGDTWGEAGHVRITRGSNECRIEEMVTAAWPLGNRRRSRARQRRTRRRRHFSH